MIDPTNPAQLRQLYPQLSDAAAQKIAAQYKENIDVIDASIYIALHEESKNERLIACWGLRMLTVMYLSHGFELPFSLRAHLTAALKTGNTELLGLEQWKPKKRIVSKSRNIAIEFEILLVRRKDNDDKFCLNKTLPTVTEEISDRHHQSVSVTERDRRESKDFMSVLRSFCDFKEWPTEENLELAALLSRKKLIADYANKLRDSIEPPNQDEQAYPNDVSLADAFLSSLPIETPATKDLHLKPKTK